MAYIINVNIVIVVVVIVIVAIIFNDVNKEILLISSVNAVPVGNGGDSNNRYIWNLELAMNCDVSPFHDKKLPPMYATAANAFQNPQNYVNPLTIKDGDIIWVPTYYLKTFYTKVLPKITTNFFLLINDGDNTFPTAYKHEFDVMALINDPRVIHIFAQNADYHRKDAKVSLIPIGLDFHTVANPNNAHVFRETFKSVDDQRKELNDLVSSFSPTNKRAKRAIIDWYLSDSKHRGEHLGMKREHVFNEIMAIPNVTSYVDVVQERLQRHALWEKKGEYAFSISVFGNGMDCHRTWEDLVLGCIVIVKSTVLDPLYDGLPVAIVKDWSEITPSNMDKWLVTYGDASKTESYRHRLTFDYWMNNVIRGYQRDYLSSENRGKKHVKPDPMDLVKYLPQP